MPKDPTAHIPQKHLAAYQAVVAAHPEVEMKGAKNPYTSVNGYMFSFIAPDGVVGFRLSDEHKAAFEAKYNTGPFIRYNSVMRGYVPLPEEVLFDTKLVAKYFAMSYQDISALPPK